jgi:hypothetical protein
MRLRAISVALCAAGLSAGLPGDAARAADAALPPSGEILAFEEFITDSGPLCQKQPAQACVDAGWSYADANRDGLLSVEEIRAVRDTLVGWSGWRGDSLPNRERLSIGLGVWLIDAVGIDKLVASYSRDGDQRLSQKELLADVTLDQRPLGKVLVDAEAVDRKAMAARLGALSPVLDGLLNGPQ